MREFNAVNNTEGKEEILDLSKVKNDILMEKHNTSIGLAKY